MKLNDVPQVFIIDDASKIFYTMTEEELHDQARQHDRKLQRIFNLAVRAKTCTYAIFIDNKKSIDSLCSYSIMLNSLAPSIHHIELSTYLLINIDNYTLHCDNGVKSEDSLVDHLGCASCLIAISANCSWTNDIWFIPETFTSPGPSEIVDQQHISNVPLLMRFFELQELSLIKGDSLLQTPLKVRNLPTFNLYKRNLSETFAQDDKLKTSLDRAAVQVKNDQVIVNSLSEAIVLGKVVVNDEFFLSTPGYVVEAL